MDTSRIKAAEIRWQKQSPLPKAKPLTHDNQVQGHQQVQCPTCGHTIRLPFLPIEEQIMKAVIAAQRNEGKARTKAIAVRVMMSEDQTFRYLQKLEQQGRVRRVGVKGGWRTAA